MARYVMANRRAGKFSEAEKRASREALATGFDNLFAMSVDVVADQAPDDEQARRVLVFDADPEEVAAKAVMLPADVIVEPEILHFPVGGRQSRRRPAARKAGKRRAAKRPSRAARGSTGLPAPVDVTAAALAGVVVPADQAAAGVSPFTLTIRGSGQPLRGAEVQLHLTGPFSVPPLSSITDTSGTARFGVPQGFTPVAAVGLPAGNFWSMVARRPANGSAIDCPPIQSVGPLDWWHRLMGQAQLTVAAGAGIRVGVIDTGTGPHGCLAHVESTGAFINGQHNPAGGADVDSHGTHVSGLVGARPVDQKDRAGLAPGATLLSARVFPNAQQGASQADIANALDHLSRDKHVDLVNMSLGASRPSQIEQDAILDALERGTLCVCAAGNSAGAVNWPAAFPEVVAVSALGLLNTFPPSSVSALHVPTDQARHGTAGVFLAAFSCFGSEIDTAAPGVATISTVPERFGLVRPYAAMDGTSMASPVACGALAVLLGRSARYQSLTGLSRSQEARTILHAHCVSVGLAATFQGRGIARIP